MTSATVAFGSRTRPLLTGTMTPRISRGSSIISEVPAGRRCGHRRGYTTRATARSGRAGRRGSCLLLDQLGGEFLRRAGETDHAAVGHGFDHRADHGRLGALHVDAPALGGEHAAAAHGILGHAREDDRAGRIAVAFGSVLERLVDGWAD